MRSSLGPITLAGILLLLYSFMYGCAPTPLPVKPPENYRGPIATGPVFESEDYWIYRRADGTRAKLGAGTFLARLEFPLWIGKVWQYQDTAHRSGHPEASHRTPVEVECEASAFKSIRVPAGSFEAFECKCACRVIGATGVYEPDCGEWTAWYAPRVKNIVKLKTEGTATSVDLVEYKLSEPK